MNETGNSKQIVSSSVSQSLIQDLRQIIEQARGHVAATANYELTMMYWHIGERINREVLNNQRAEYGKQIVAQVAQQLQVTYGEKGFEKSSITRMMKFAKLFPNEQIGISDTGTGPLTKYTNCIFSNDKVIKKNEEALKFWNEQGFKVVEETVSTDGYEVYRMARDI